MSAFFAHLAGIALGRTAAGDARLSVPPRFAQIETGDAGFEAGESDEAPAARTPAPVPLPEHGAPARAPAPDDVPVQSAAASELPESPPISAEPPGRDAARQPRRRQRPLRAAELHVRQEIAAVPATTRSPAAPSAREREPGGAGDPPSPPAQAVTLPGEIRLTEAEAAAPPPASRRPARMPAAPERPSAPLSDKALAGRSGRLRQADPVIHVTIDRIDVRAPAGPKPPPPRRPPAEPSVSLAEFLRRGGSGTRQ